jgi:hypothetical protein
VGQPRWQTLAKLKDATNTSAMQTTSPLAECLDQVSQEINYTAWCWQQCEGEEHLQSQVAALALAHFLREAPAALELIWAHSEG